MPVVGMPDGTQVSFPDEMPADQIKQLIGQKFPNEVKQAAPDWTSKIPRAIADVPSEIANAAGENWHAIKEGFYPEEGKAGQIASQGAIGSTLATGKGLLGIAGLAMSPITGAARSLLGHPLADVTHYAGTKIAPDIAAKDDPKAMYEAAKGGVDTAMSAAAPARGGLPTLGLRAPVPPTTGPLGVTLSEGQATRDLGAIQREQQARRAPTGASGERAQAFQAQQAGEVQSARDRISQGFNQFGQTMAETPQEAGQVVQQSVQREAQNRRAGVDRAYETARSQPGELDADVFNGMGTRIRQNLFNEPNNPVIIDDRTTPIANNALSDLDAVIQRMQASTGTNGTVAGLDLNGVDQARKRLNSFYRQTQGGSPDQRAMRSIISEFDSNIDQAVNSNAFSGDPAAVRAWNAARAAHTDFRQTFGNQSGRNDPVGRVVQKIIGNRDNPAAIPNDVADFIYGGSGINPNSLNVAVANRIRGILGDRSPEWSGVKQGLFSRLVETPPGVTDFGPGRVAQRVNNFLSGGGREMAEAVFTPAERTLLQQYADLHRALEVPQAGANWSNTSTILMPMLKKISGGVAAIIGGAIGHTVAPGAYGAAEAVGAVAMGRASGAVQGAMEARQIARQMPLVVESARRFQRAMQVYNRANSAPSGVALQVATANLARSLRHIGVDIAVQGPSPGRAEDQPQVSGPPGQ